VADLAQEWYTMWKMPRKPANSALFLANIDARLNAFSKRLGHPRRHG
jgi:hypothetical protein